MSNETETNITTPAGQTDKTEAELIYDAHVASRDRLAERIATRAASESRQECPSHTDAQVDQLPAETTE